MRLFQPEEEQKVYVNDNPKGTINRQYESCVRQASYLAIVCAHWLQYWNGHIDRARDNEPFYDPPEAWPDQVRFKKARKLCGFWDRTRYGEKKPTLRWKESQGWRRANRNPQMQESIPVAQPNASATTGWRTVFDRWWSGTLQRDIDSLLAVLPEENRVRVVEELDKF